MTNKLFKISFWAIIIFALIIRLLPARNNNFYFTMDQGNDAVYVREILTRHQILLDGPETGIIGVYHDPFWYYFIGIGYLATGGHPFGAVLMLIILNVATTAIIILKIAKEVSKTTGLLIGFSLQFFWWFYDASRYGFNPFPLVALSIFLILLLGDFLKGRRQSFILAAVPVGLAFHCESAAAITFATLYFLVGCWGIAKKKLAPPIILAGIFLLVLFFVPRLISEIKSGFAQSKVLKRELANPNGIFGQTRYQFISIKFKEILTKRITPQSNEAGIAVLTLVFLLFLKSSPKNQFTRRFTYLSLTLVLISWAWFGSNRGWQVWHTVYIKPILFMAILLMLANIIKVKTNAQRLISLFLLIIILISQMLFFKDRYLQFAYSSNDPSLLTNELAAVDWVYQKSAGRGFYVYSYLPSVYDYPYQYLFWWYGRQHYGYVPCEYSTFPNVDDFFVPGLKHYQSPQKECSQYRFLIVEPDINKHLQDSWLTQVRKDTILLEEATFGAVRVEKRQL